MADAVRCLMHAGCEAARIVGGLVRVGAMTKRQTTHDAREGHHRHIIIIIIMTVFHQRGGTLQPAGG